MVRRPKMPISSWTAAKTDAPATARGFMHPLPRAAIGARAGHHLRVATLAVKVLLAPSFVVGASLAVGYRRECGAVNLGLSRQQRRSECYGRHLSNSLARSSPTPDVARILGPAPRARAAFRLSRRA